MLQIQNYQRQFTLFELLQQKYGADKIELGLQLLAQWLSGSSAIEGFYTYTFDFLKELMLAPKDPKAQPVIDPATLEELRKFFGLLTIDQLYNKEAL